MKNGLDLIVLYTCLTKKQKHNGEGAKNLMADLKRISGTGKVPSVEDLRPLVGKLRFFDVLQKIAKENRTEAFGADTVSFYWKCFPILKGGNSHNEAVLGDIWKVPNHLINEQMITELNNCLVFVGKVANDLTNGHRLLVKRGLIVNQDERLLLTETEGEVIVSQGEDLAIVRVSEGDHVTLHWGVAVEKITKEEALALIEETRAALNRFNARRA